MERFSTWMAGRGMGKGLDEIGERAFGFAEVGDPGEEEGERGDGREGEAWPEEGRGSGEEAEAEAIDDADDGIEGIEEAPLGGDERALESDWGEVEAELDDEGDDIAEVAKFDHEGGDPDPEAEGSGEGEEDEGGEEDDLGWGEEVIIGEEQSEEEGGDGEVHETGEDTTHGDDESGEVDFGDEIGVADETGAAFGEGIGEELPGEEAREDEERVRDATGG